MKVLITGAAGMVGSHAAEYYANKKCRVVALDNLMRSKIFGFNRKSVEYNWHYLAKFKNIKRIKADIRDKACLKKIFKSGIDLCIHTAAQPGVGFSIDDPLEDFSINASGTLNVLESIRRYNKKRCSFIYCSTNKVYGENVSLLPLKEDKTRYVYKNTTAISEKMDIDLTTHTPYGISKYTGDLYAQDYASIYGIKTGIFRMSCIYGARQFGFEDQGWLAHFIISMLGKKPITIYGDGKQVRDVLYVTDLVRAFDSFHRSKYKNGVFNIGGGAKNSISLMEFIDMLKKKLSINPKIKFAKWRAADQKVYISDIKKVERALCWSPEISVSDGVDKLIRWISVNKGYFK